MSENNIIKKNKIEDLLIECKLSPIGKNNTPMEGLLAGFSASVERTIKEESFFNYKSHITMESFIIDNFVFNPELKILHERRESRQIAAQTKRIKEVETLLFEQSLQLYALQKQNRGE